MIEQEKGKTMTKTRIARKVVEYSTPNEDEAHDTRRKLMTIGRRVSLIGFDTSREVYAFDVHE